MSKVKAKYTAKNSVFCDLFSISQYLLELAKVLHPEEEITEGDLTTLSLRSILSGGIYNDLGFQVKDRLMILVEAQSSWSPSVLIRILIYLIQTLQEYFERNKINLYKNKKITFPKPELYVIYSKQRKDQPEYLSFQEEYFPDGCCIDVKVKIIYLDENDDNNNIINQYIRFCRIFDEQIAKYDRTEEAIDETIRICQEQGILVEYLEHRKVEVKGIMYTLFSQERVDELNLLDAKEEGREEGRAEGRVEGEAKGRAEGEAKGKFETTFENIKSAMKNFKVSAKKAMAALEVPAEDQPKYLNMLQLG